ncbi:MAG: AbrB/MazE/SpoVT family DNA-binding domain-containing protein [Nocardioides sp.]
MEATVDSAGRVLIPKALREALGIKPGGLIDLSVYGDGLHLVPGGRTASLVEDDGVLVVDGTSAFGDEEMFALIDAGRR